MSKFESVDAQEKNVGLRAVKLFGPHRSKVLLIAGLVLGDAAASIAWPFFLRGILDDAIPHGRIGLLSILACGMLISVVVSNVLGVFQALVSNRMGHCVMHNLRVAVFKHMQALSLRYFTHARSGDVQSRLVSDIGGMETTMTSAMTSLVSNFASVFATLIAMLALEWKLTLFVLPFLAAFVWVSRRVGRERHTVIGKRQQQIASMTGVIGESLSVGGILLAKTMGRSGSLRQRFEKISADLADIEVESSMSGRWRMSGIGMVMAGAPPILYWVAGVTADFGGSAPTVGTLVAFVTLQQALMWPTLELLTTGVQMQSSTALLERIFEFLDADIDIVDPAMPRALGNDYGEVVLKNVSFSYAGKGGSLALDDVNLSIPSGSHTAVVGVTGSGKTTLGHVIARLYDVDSGAVSVNQVDVREAPIQSLSDVIGVVSQDPFFFNSTIVENLLFAKPEATYGEMVASAKMAHIHDFVLGLPEGYETILGERGHRLSGGEKQRLAIARAILKNPAIMILDEATSALDVITEAAVQKALDALPGRTTRITIAHRLSTVRDADQIVVLDRGRIVEKGTHDSLVSANGYYANFVERDSSFRRA